MAVLDFPASPAVNDIYTANNRSWIWTGVVWNAYSTGLPSISASDGPPTSVVANQMWFESDTGKTFIFYDGFWVEMATTTGGAVYPAGLSTARPTSPSPGTVIFETDTKRTVLYDGTGWIIMREPTQALTATARQNSVTVAATVVSTGFKRSDGWCDVYVQLNLTGTGTNATPFDVVISGQPGPIVASGTMGAFMYYDAGNLLYAGSANLAANGTIGFTTTGTNYTLGANPAFAVANGDSIGVTLRYCMSNLYG